MNSLQSTEPPLRLAILIGSTREGRFAPTVARWFASQAEEREGLSVDVIDLAQVALPGVLNGSRSAEAVEVSRRLERAEAFVVITPEYNHSFPAPLKNAIDWHYEEWRAKPVGFVSYGGASGGLRAVEQLRQIFAELHAVTVRDGVSFHGARTQFDAAGEPIDAARAEGAVKRMLGQIAWWGLAMRDAKKKQPYGTGWN